MLTKEEIIQSLDFPIVFADDIEIDDIFRNDHDIALAIRESEGYEHKYHHHLLVGDRDYAIKHLKMNPLDIKYCDTKDKELCAVAASSDGLSIEHMSSAMLKDLDIVTHALINDGMAYQFLKNKKIRSNPNIIEIALKSNGAILEFMDESVKQSYQMVQHAVTSNGVAIEFAPLFKDNFYISELAVKSNGRALQYVAEKFKDNYQLVELAIKNNPFSFQYASSKLRSNKTLMMKSFESSFEDSVKIKDIFECVDIGLRSDKEFVMHAIEKNPSILALSSHSLQDDTEVAYKAVNAHECAYWYVSERLQNDKELLLIALEKCNSYEDHKGSHFKGIVNEVPDELKSSIDPLDPLNSLRKLMLNEKLSADLQVGDATVKKMKV